MLWLHGLSDLPHGEGEAAEPQETEESPPPLQPGYQPAQKKKKMNMFASSFRLGVFNYEISSIRSLCGGKVFDFRGAFKSKKLQVVIQINLLLRKGMTCSQSEAAWRLLCDSRMVSTSAFA